MAVCWQLFLAFASSRLSASVSFDASAFFSAKPSCIVMIGALISTLRTFS